MKWTIPPTLVLALGAALLVVPALQANAAVTIGTTTIADGGWGGNRDLYTSESFAPDTDPVTIGGTVDLSGLTNNSAMLIGLVDKDAADADPFADYLQGAYAYFGYRSGWPELGYRVGASNGNDGGELIGGGFYPTSATVDYSVVIGGGDIAFASGGFSETIAYSADDFPSGSAYLAIDLWSPQGSADYGLTAEGGPDGVIPEPGSVAIWALLTGAFGLALVYRRRSRHAR